MQTVNGFYTSEAPWGVAYIIPTLSRLRFYINIMKIGPDPFPEFWVFGFQYEHRVPMVEFKTVLWLDHPHILWKGLCVRMPWRVNLTSPFRLLYSPEWSFKSHYIRRKLTLVRKMFFLYFQTANFPSLLYFIYKSHWVTEDPDRRNRSHCFMIILPRFPVSYNMPCNMGQFLNTRAKGDVANWASEKFPCNS